MSQVIQTPEQQYYLTKLLGYEFDIVYRSGHSNAAADALSRVPAEHLHTYSTLKRGLMEDLRAAQLTDPELQNLHEQHKQSLLPKGYSVQHGLILFNKKFFLLRTSPLIDQILLEFHSSPQGGHFGILKTYKQVAEQFYWKNMKNIVATFISSCLICQ